MQEKSNETRIAVTESRLDAHAQMLENNQELTAKLVDRLDGHIQLSLARDDRIQENLSNVTIAVTKLSSTVTEATEAIKVLTPAVTEGKEALHEWKTIRKTIVVIATVLVTLGSGTWAVFTYFDHQSHIDVTTQK